MRQEVLAHGQWILPPHGQQIHGALGAKAQGGTLKRSGSGAGVAYGGMKHHET